MTATSVISGVNLETWRSGDGPPLLLLHDIECLNQPRPFTDLLAKDFSVVSPSHPGFGASDLPANFDSVGDLAYLYLDLLREMGPADVVGLGLGGWIAAEMAVRNSHDIRNLILVDAVGIKTADRETPEIADTFVMDPRRFLACSWHDAGLAEKHMVLPELQPLDESRLATLLRNRQSAALFGWNPFMHNPKLYRRLYRVDVPTLVVWGASDHVVGVDYGRAYAESIPGARFEVLDAAGHYPYLERPEAFVDVVAGFLKRSR